MLGCIRCFRRDILTFTGWWFWWLLSPIDRGPLRRTVGSNCNPSSRSTLRSHSPSCLVPPRCDDGGPPKIADEERVRPAIVVGCCHRYLYTVGAMRYKREQKTRTTFKIAVALLRWVEASRCSLLLWRRAWHAADAGVSEKKKGRCRQNSRPFHHNSRQR